MDLHVVLGAVTNFLQIVLPTNLLPAVYHTSYSIWSDSKHRWEELVHTLNKICGCVHFPLKQSLSIDKLSTVSTVKENIFYNLRRSESMVVSTFLQAENAIMVTQADKNEHRKYPSIKMVVLFSCFLSYIFYRYRFKNRHSELANENQSSIGGFTCTNFANKNSGGANKSINLHSDDNSTTPSETLIVDHNADSVLISDDVSNSPFFDHVMPRALYSKSFIEATFWKKSSNSSELVSPATSIHTEGYTPQGNKNFEPEEHVYMNDKPQDQNKSTINEDEDHFIYIDRFRESKRIDYSQFPGHMDELDDPALKGTYYFKYLSTGIQTFKVDMNLFRPNQHPQSIVRICIPNPLQDDKPGLSEIFWFLEENKLLPVEQRIPMMQTELNMFLQNHLINLKKPFCHLFVLLEYKPNQLELIEHKLHKLIMNADKFVNTDEILPRGRLLSLTKDLKQLRICLLRCEALGSTIKDFNYSLIKNPIQCYNSQFTELFQMIQTISGIEQQLYSHQYYRYTDLFRLVPKFMQQ